MNLAEAKEIRNQVEPSNVSTSVEEMDRENVTCGVEQQKLSDNKETINY